MPTTPNYGWDTPADTDYVTNGALAIRTMANDADATVKANEDATNAAIATLDSEKVDKAGDFMTGPLLVLNNAAAGRGLGIQQDVANDEAIFQIVNDGGTIQQASIKVFADNTMTFALTSNSNTLVINNVGELLRGHLGEDRPLPFAMETGIVDVSANSDATVFLESGRFTQAPVVMATPNSITTSAITWHVGTRTTSSFKLFNTSSSTRQFMWQAIQMRSASAVG
jgi:hypothetical protein